MSAPEVQFDPNIHGRINPSGKRISDFDEMRATFGTIEGFQIKKIRRPLKTVPDWARSDQALKLRIFRVPIRRYRVAYLYWRVGWSSREISEELKIKLSSVKSVIRELLAGDRDR